MPTGNTSAEQTSAPEVDNLHLPDKCLILLDEEISEYPPYYISEGILRPTTPNPRHDVEKIISVDSPEGKKILEKQKIWNMVKGGGGVVDLQAIIAFVTRVQEEREKEKFAAITASQRAEADDKKLPPDEQYDNLLRDKSRMASLLSSVVSRYEPSNVVDQRLVARALRDLDEKLTAQITSHPLGKAIQTKDVAVKNAHVATEALNSLNNILHPTR